MWGCVDAEGQHSNTCCKMQRRNILIRGPWTNYIKSPIPHFEFTEQFIIIKVLTKITIKHKTTMKCEVKSYFIIKEKFLGSGLGPPRPRRPLAFVQPCPMGVTPLVVTFDIAQLFIILIETLFLQIYLFSCRNCGMTRRKDCYSNSLPLVLCCKHNCFPIL